MRITAKGQVTIPVALRERAGLMPDTEVAFELDGDAVRIVRAEQGRKLSRGRKLVAAMRGRGDRPMSTDAIMALTRGE